MTYNNVRQLVELSLREFIELPEINTDTELYGSTLDSLGLVGFLISIEEKLSNNGFQVTLASEKAMSRYRSPFRTVGSLTDFIFEELCQ